MNLTFLGTAAGGLRRKPGALAVCNATAIYLEHNDRGLLLDCGPGVMPGIVYNGVALETIECILLSHLHQDHAAGLLELLVHMVSARLPMPFIEGPRGTSAYVTATTEAARQVSYGGGKFGGPLHTPVEDIESGDEREVLGLRVRTVEVPHTPALTSVARRLEADGRILVFSGDTTASASIMVELARGADVLVHECYSAPGIERWVADRSAGYAAAMSRGFRNSHSEVTEVARVAAEAGVKTLVLTHLNEGEREEELIALARPHFAGEIIVAADGLDLTVQ